jgi:poly(A) polymerase
VDELLGYCEAVADVMDDSIAEIEFCREKLALPGQVFNPPPLITGEDLKQLGIPPGPAYRELLDAVRDAQLEGAIATRDEALRLVKSRTP